MAGRDAPSACPEGPADMTRRTAPRLGLLLLMATLTTGATADEPDAAARARRLVTAHEEKVRPLEKAAALSWWDANVTGKDEAFRAKEEAQNRLDAALADAATFAELKAL